MSKEGCCSRRWKVLWARGDRKTEAVGSSSELQVVVVVVLKFEEKYSYIKDDTL